ncbi:polysaccharide deacetylase family protein [Phenylobacterium sp.]|uniref:polysaccharide deacetylase family protein n=1 Tax=Phenylobacterium sp. TaxID=1871053 RepID=UPI0037837B4D
MAVAAIGAVWWAQRPDPAVMHVFSGVRGPKGRARVVEPPRANIADFDRGGPHRLAILVTDPQSGWLGLVRGFRSHGVPVTVTQNPAKALRHRVVLVYPIVSGRVLDGAQLRALAGHVRAGGTVLAFNLAGGGLGELFGVGAGAESNMRTRLRWTTPAGEPRTDELAVSSARETRIATFGYAPTTTRVLARFEDGATAAACRTVVGQACVLGVDLGAFAQRAMNGRAEVVSRSYVNAYEPSLDVLFRWVRDLYVAGEPMPWLISTAPAGKQVSILLSHDIDAGTSPANSVTYAQALKARGLSATFFVQTKYMKDYNDVAFFNDAAVAATRRLVSSGMDVGSHTVAHSREFESMPLGEGRERYPAYRPFVEGERAVRDATILGELRVSKYLLDRLAGAQVRSFRPGRLSYPFSLPQALEATGYRYSSSLTANMALTHLPFQLTDSRGDGALQPVWEFPVAIEDELPPSLGDRLDAADRLVGQIARDRGVATILIHPNVTDHKLAFETVLADRWRDRAWIGSISAFGDWWRARDALDTDVALHDGRWVLQAAAPLGAADVAVILPKARRREVRLNLPANGAVTHALP